MRVAVIGLGSMGYGMGLRLLEHGMTVHGVDIDQDRVAQFCRAGGAKGALLDHATTLDAVVLVVVNAEQAKLVLFDQGLADQLPENAVVVGCSTVPPAFAQSVEKQLAKRNIHYLDAPISGGAGKAATGALTVMASGKAKAFDRAKPVLDATAVQVFRLGDRAGAGSAMKAVNQLLAGVHLTAMAEAVTFGMTQGIAPATCVEVISKCAGTSWMFENRAPHVLEGDYTPRSAVEIFVKDLGIVSDIARSARFSAPLAAAALQQFLAAAGMGLGREDDAAIAKVYARNARLSLPGEDG